VLDLRYDTHIVASVSARNAASSAKWGAATKVVRLEIGQAPLDEALQLIALRKES